MKAHLLWPDRDVDFTLVLHRGRSRVEGPDLSASEEALAADLGLDAVLAAMADGDPVLLEISRRVVLAGLGTPEAIRYRQAVLADFTRNEEASRGMLEAVTEAVGAEQRLSAWAHSPDAVLRRSVDALELLVGVLRRLRSVADENAGSFTSPGFTALFRSLRSELSDGYFEQVEDHLERLRFRDGVLVSARLGPGLAGVDGVLRSAPPARIGLRERLRLEPQSEYHWDLPPRDEAGSRILAEMHARAIAGVAAAAAQSVTHIAGFLVMLRIELGFYSACANLLAALRALRRPVCFPEPLPEGPSLRFEGLCDAGLALNGDIDVVGNDADADGKALVMVTGANSGGKSTFLRSVGLALVMMQAGMFVTAGSFAADPPRRLHTHFIREEDPAMSSGKLDEELARMDAIADDLRHRDTVLFNESFAATNEREGSAIAGQIVRALLDSGVRVLFVTHQFTLADDLYRRRSTGALFLRADRRPDGTRTFKVVEGRPLRTGFGADLYRRIGGWDAPDALRHGQIDERQG